MQNFKSSNPNKLILASAFALVLLVGCSSAPPANPQAVCTERFTKAEAKFKDGDWYRSIEPLEALLTDCHGSGYMERTQFMLAESRFHLEDWIEARGEYTTFILNFPSSPYIETATFRKALSAYNMSYTDMRDDSPTQTAMRDFQDFVDNFPSSGLLDSAHHYQESLNNRLGEKDYQTAHLYWRMGEPLACAMYLKTFINQYPSSPRQLDAHLLIIDAYIDLNQFDPAQTYLDRLAELFPDAKKQRLSRIDDLASARAKFESHLKDEQVAKQYRKEDAR